MKYKYSLLALLVVICSLPSRAARSTDSDSDEPKGQAIVRIFTNFHTGFGTMNDRRGFELDRSYLGYEYTLGHGLKVKAVLDVGKSSDVSDYQRIAYIKNAQLSWKYKDLTLHGGLISTTMFGIQEKFWGNRYIMKSFQDHYGFGSSADLGISASYQLTNWLSADAILVNGEGYKKIQIDDGLMYGLGITLTPIQGLTMRIYGSWNESSDKDKKSENSTDIKGKDCYNLATFIGYKNHKFSLAGEYNLVDNLRYQKGAKLQGASVYGIVNLSRITRVYTRYDQLFSIGEVLKDEEEISWMGGVEIKIGKYVKLSPNIRYVRPGNSNQKDYFMAYLNCYFGL